MDHVVPPAARLAGEVSVPGDKSVSHRGLILGAMASGTSRIAGCASGADVISTLGCVRALGAAVEADGEVVEIEGNGWEVSGEHDLEAANSGTTMRLLAGAVAGRPGRFRFAGDASLSRRPMDRIAEPLRQMGAVVDLTEGRFPPMTITGSALRGIRYALPVASAQVKGAILLAGLQAEGETEVLERDPSRDHTERLMRWLGVSVEQTPGTIRLKGTPSLPLPSFVLPVPGDFSSAAFWIVAACLSHDSAVTVRNAGLNPSRTGLLGVLVSMGAAIEVELETEQPEPAGPVIARTSALRATEIGGGMIPSIIDELPLVALAGTQAEGTTVIRDAEELRVKESDRIAGLAAGLRTLGASVEETRDGMIVEGPTPLRGGRVDSLGDHRLAMTFAVAGLISAEAVTVEGWESTAISYPTFERDLELLAR